MSTAIAYDYRKKIIEMRQGGTPYKSIASTFNCSERSVQRLWKKFQKEGAACLHTKYHLSGRKRSSSQELLDKIAKVKDGEQGAPYVRSILLAENPSLKIPHERTLQRWWKKEGTNRPVGRPKSKANWTNKANHTWQIDGKGHLQLGCEHQASWMKIADEGTSSDLDTHLFPPSGS